MKQTTILGWVMLMVVFGLVSWQTHRNNRVCDARTGATKVEVDTVEEEIDTVEEDDTSRVIISSTEVIDTVVGDWQIYGIKKPNRYKIKYLPNDYELNNSVFLTLRYRGRVVLKNKEISSRMLSGSPRHYVLSAFELLHVSPSAVYFNFTDNEPEACGFFNFVYCVPAQGKPKLYDVEGDDRADIGYLLTRLSEMFAIYFHEKINYKATFAELEPLLSSYFTKEVIDEMRRKGARGDEEVLFGRPLQDVERVRKTQNFEDNDEDPWTKMTCAFSKNAADTVALRYESTPLKEDEEPKIARIMPWK